MWRYFLVQRERGGKGIGGRKRETNVCVCVCVCVFVCVCARETELERNSERQIEMMMRMITIVINTFRLPLLASSLVFFALLLLAVLLSVTFLLAATLHTETCALNNNTSIIKATFLLCIPFQSIPMSRSFVFLSSWH